MSKDLTATVEVPRVKTAIVRNSDVTEGLITVEYEDQPGQYYSIKLIGSTAPDIGTRGVVLMSLFNQRSGTAYWIGKIIDKYDLNASIKNNSNNTESLRSKKGNSIIEYNDAGISLINDSNKIVLTTNAIDMKHRRGKFSLSDSIALNLTDDYSTVISGLLIQKEYFSLISGGGADIAAIGNIAIRSQGNVLISGPIDESKANSGIDNAAMPINTFGVKANRVSIASGGGPMMLSGGSMNIKLGSSLLSGGGSAPGTGSTTTLGCEIIQGDLGINVGVGNIDIIANNYTFISSINLRNGAIISPLKTGLTLDIKSAKLYEQLLPGIEAYLTLSMASAELYATKSIDISSLMGIKIDALKNVEISTLLQLVIDATVKATIKTAMLEIEGTMMTKIKTTMLDLKEAKTIDIGNKVVTPSGVPGFLAIGICPILGTPIGGTIAVG